LIACRNEGSESPSVVTGVVIGIESQGLNRVSSFTVKDGDNEYEIKVDGDTRFTFTPSHLQEHRATAEPVRVEIDDSNGVLRALSVDDA